MRVLPAAKSMSWRKRLAWAAGTLLLLGGLQAAQPYLDPYYARILLLAGINIILAVSLNLINGFTGQFSIGHAGFMAVGAYTGAAISVFFGENITDTLAALGLPDALSLPALLITAVVVGATAAALMGLVVGLPSLRLRGDYLAIATIGFGEGIRSLIENTRAVGGASGFYGIPPATNFFWIFLFVVGVILFSRSIALSSHGRALFAIREDELAAESVGINTFRYKVLIFVIGAAWAGVAGVLLAHLELTISPQPFGFMRSVEVVVMVVLGGMGSITGAVIAAVVLTALPEFLRTVLGALPQAFGSVNDYRMVIYSLILIILMLTRPQGLFGRHEFGPAAAIRGLIDERLARLRRKNGAS